MSQQHRHNFTAPLELVEPTGDFSLRPDRRPRMEEPLPVKLVTVDDAELLTSAGLERALDAFYVDLVGFVRTGSPHDLSYRADNFTLHFRVEEPPVRRETLRALGVEVQSLGTIEQRLIDEQIEYTWQEGLMPGHQSIAVLDPAGNWLELTESRTI
jgi:catechol 2,3-dioxygenase-like lactoylglutathione lyase family enzyme